MAKKRKPTPAEREYRKQLQRIKRFIQRAEKRGYQFNKSLIPAPPKRITKASVERLRKITPQKLYRHAIYTTPSLETIPAEERRLQERKEAAQKAALTRAKKRPYLATDTSGLTKPLQPPPIVDNVLTTVEEILNLYSRTGGAFQNASAMRNANVLKNMLEMQIAMDGRKAVAERLERASDEVIKALEGYVYGHSKQEDLAVDVARFARIIKGEGLTAEEARSILDLQDEYNL